MTTFTKDGRPKPTPVWGVPDGDRLLVITDDGSWKVKRIRNAPRVTIARSAALGKPKSEEVEAVARVLPKSETQRVYNAVLKRYWYHAWWFLCALDPAGRRRQRTHRYRGQSRRLESFACHHGLRDHCGRGDADTPGHRYRDRSAFLASEVAEERAPQRRNAETS